MKIGHIAPINFNIPNGRSGPTQIFVNLNEGLAQINPQLTVFACKNSRVSGDLKYIFDCELNSLPEFERSDRMLRGLFLMEHVAQAYQDRQNVDIYLSHQSVWGVPVASLIKDRPTVTIIHNITPDLFRQLKHFNAPHLHFVCQSEAIAAVLRQQIDNVSVIHNGLDLQSIKPAAHKKDYFLYLGRLTAPKGLDIAIDICLKKKKKLIIIGKPVLTEAEHAKYFQEEIEPRLKNELITYIPEVEHAKVYDFYREARALIFPMRDYTRECLPMTVPESLACGTPVLSLKNPLSREIITDGKTGFLAESSEELADDLDKVDELKPQDCRAAAEKEFSREVMAQRYRQLLERSAK